MFRQVQEMVVKQGGEKVHPVSPTLALGSESNSVVVGVGHHAELQLHALHPQLDCVKVGGPNSRQLYVMMSET